MAASENAPKTKLPASEAAGGLRIAATLLRMAFLLVLVAVTIRVSLPQSETIWSAYETTDDLIRLLLGIGVSVWLVWQLFRGPNDGHGYRIWLYLGLVALPFSLICLVAIW